MYQYQWLRVIPLKEPKALISTSPAKGYVQWVIGGVHGTSVLMSVAILVVFDICGCKAKVYCSANLIVKLVLLCKELPLLLLYSFNDCLQCLGCR